jgi:hypothetical protein
VGCVADNVTLGQVSVKFCSFTLVSASYSHVYLGMDRGSVSGCSSSNIVFPHCGNKRKKNCVCVF